MYQFVVVYFYYLIDVSPAVVSFDGDNEIEDTVRLTRFLLDCSIDGDDDEEMIDLLYYFGGVIGGFVFRQLLLLVVDSVSSAERTVS